MLSAADRLVDSADHKLVARRGRKGRSGPVVVSVFRPVPPASSPSAEDSVVRATVVVPKRVGTSVQRSRVQRQLRHLLRDRLSVLPVPCLTVVRAEPGSFGLTSGELAHHLDRGLSKALEDKRAAPVGAAPGQNP